MKFEEFNPQKTTQLVGYDKEFLLFKEMIFKNQLPKVSMLTGEKGIGKFTFINHLMHFYFDKKNYNEKNFTISKKDIFHNQLIKNIFSNILYINSSSYKNVKIDDMRKLKLDLLKPPLNNEKRFIIIDEIETFNTNSLNAILKLIEEPTKNNFFMLINNKSRTLLETVKSRSIEFNINLNSKLKNKILSFLMSYFNQSLKINENLVNISPGNMLKINSFFLEEKIDIEDNFFENFNHILNLYKKEKNDFYKFFLIFLVEYYFQFKKLKNVFNNKQIIKKRSFFIKNINDYFLYNLNQSTLVNSLQSEINNE